MWGRVGLNHDHGTRTCWRAAPAPTLGLVTHAPPTGASATIRHNSWVQRHFPAPAAPAHAGEMLLDQ